MMASQRITQVTQYILEHFDQKTYRRNKAYIFNSLTNLSEVASPSAALWRKSSRSSVSAVLTNIAALKNKRQELIKKQEQQNMKDLQEYMAKNNLAPDEVIARLKAGK